MALAAPPAYTATGLPVLAATPTTPPVGTVLTYAKADLKVYELDSNGVETQIGSGGGSSGEAFFLSYFMG